VLDDPAMSPLARRTSARLAGSAGGRGVVGRNVGTFLQRARYMTLETMAALSDDPVVGLPAMVI